MTQIELEEVDLPAQAKIKVELSITSEINITGYTAQRKVSKLLLDEVANLLYGERPNLVVGQRLLWRVPVWVGVPRLGPVGGGGGLGVEAPTGVNCIFPDILLYIVDHWICH